MTPKEARDLCILAHAGQFRRDRLMTKEELKYANANITRDDIPVGMGFEFMLPNGNKLINCMDNYTIAEPYHTHPLAVADMLDTDEEKIVGYLHDVIEDTDAELVIINSGGFKEFAINFHGKDYFISAIAWDAIQVLTKTADIKNYTFYINKITTLHYFDLELMPAQELAVKVKLVDMFHNMSTSDSNRQKQKYLSAIPTLLKAL